MENQNSGIKPWLKKNPEYHPVYILRPGIWRIITAPIRVLPDFLIIGAGKCGTTSLYNYLIQHPNISAAKFKELNYFGRRWTKFYRPNFPTIFSKFFFKRFQKELLITGEASPYYLINPLVANEVRKKIPSIKIIILLRNPVDRAFSQYNQWKKTGIETHTFEDAIKLEKIKNKKEWENYIDDDSPGSRSHVRFSYLAGGLYYEQIKNWMSVFPKEQFLILKAEDFFSEPSKIFSQILDFLEVKHYEVDFSKKYNARQYKEINPNSKKFLQNFFKPHNEKLYKLLGRNFNWDY